MDCRRSELIATHPQVEEAIRVVEENKHWIYKQCSDELEKAILELLAFAKWKLQPEDK
jgi:hypothetical protein